MSTKRKDAEVRLVMKNRKYNRNLKNSQTRTQRFFAFVNRAAKAGAVALALLTAGLAAYAKSAVSAYRLQERSEHRLKAALRATGREVTLNSALIKSYAGDLQKATTIGDETSIAVAAIGISMNGIATKDIPLYLQAIADYATATAKATGQTRDMGSIARRVSGWLNDLDGSVATIAKEIRGWTDAETEHVRELIKSGRASEAQIYVLRRMAESYKGAAASAREGTGIIDSLKNAYGDLNEMMGKLVFDRLQPYLQKATEWLESDENKNRVVARGNEILDDTLRVTKAVWQAVKSFYGATGLGFLVKTVREDLIPWMRAAGLTVDNVAKAFYTVAIGADTARLKWLEFRSWLKGGGDEELTAEIDRVAARIDMLAGKIAELSVVRVTAARPDEEPPGEPPPDDGTVKKPLYEYSDEEWEEAHQKELDRLRLSQDAHAKYNYDLQNLEKSRRDLEQRYRTAEDEAERKSIAASLRANAQKYASLNFQRKKDLESARRFGAEEAKSAIGNLATIVGGREKAAKAIAIVETAQAVQSAMRSLALEPPKIFAKIAGQTGLWGLAKAAAVSLSAATAIKAGIGKIKGYKDGGVIPGNPLAGDSVPILAQPGEEIVRQPVVQAIRELLAAREEGAPDRAIRIIVDREGLGNFLHAEIEDARNLEIA